MSKDLPLGDVLSVTTGRLVSRDHIGGVYNVCDYMSGESNMTHQLPRVCEECRPVILRQHPELTDVRVPDWPDPVTAEVVFAWLTEVEAEYGAMVALDPMDAIDHTSIGPLTELAMMRPDLPVVAVVVDDGD